MSVARARIACAFLVAMGLWSFAGARTRGGPAGPGASRFPSGSGRCAGAIGRDPGCGNCDASGDHDGVSPRADVPVRPQCRDRDDPAGAPGGQQAHRAGKRGHGPHAAGAAVVRGNRLAAGVVEGQTAADGPVVEWAHQADHRSPGRGGSPDATAGEMEPDAGVRAGVTGAPPRAPAGRRSPRGDRRRTGATARAAHRRARPPESRGPGGCPVQRRPGADRARPGAGDGGDPGAGRPSDLERRGVG